MVVPKSIKSISAVKCLQNNVTYLRFSEVDQTNIEASIVHPPPYKPMLALFFSAVIFRLTPATPPTVSDATAEKKSISRVAGEVCVSLGAGADDSLE